MRSLIIAFLVWVTAYQAFAQTDVLNVTPSVNTNTFSIETSITYSSKVYKDYKLVMTLPSDISWNQSSYSENAAISISNTGNIYTISINGPDNIDPKGISVDLNGFVNNRVPKCEAQPLTINYELKATLKSSNLVQSLKTAATSVNTIILTSTTPSISPSATVYYEGENYPLYVHLSGSKQGIINSPNLVFQYNTSKLEFKRAVRYSSYTPFNTVDVTTDLSETGKIKMADFLGSYDVRLYFKPIGTSTLDPTLDMSFTALNGIGSTCENPTIENITGQAAIGGGIKALNQTQTTLLPMLDTDVRHVYSCSNDCNFNINSLTGSFYFEANNVYESTNQPSTVTLQVPEAVLVKSLQLELGQYLSNSLTDVPTVRYKPIGGNEQDAIYSNNGTYAINASVEYIVISGYNKNAPYDKAKDFVLTYQPTTVTFSNLPDANRIFKLSYVSQVVKASSPIYFYPTYYCNNRINFYDKYYSGNAFTPYVIYSSNQESYLLLQIEPASLSYKNTYEFTNVKYQLNSNMELIDTKVKYLENGTFNNLNNYKNLDANGIYYKNIKASITLSKEEGTIAINGLRLDNTINCNDPKTLYLLVKVRVKDKTSYQDGYHRSTLNVGTSTFISTGLGGWNVPSSFLLGADIVISCAGEEYKTATFRNGESVTVNNIVRNENSSQLKDLILDIPVIQMGSIPLESDNEPTFSAYEINQNDEIVPKDFLSIFNVAPNGSNKNRLSTKVGYVLNGYHKLVVVSKYKINTDLTVGSEVNDVKFLLVSAQRIGSAVGASNVPPSQGITIKIGNVSTCLYDNSNCAECVTSFSPVPTERYLLSAWVKEEFSTKTPDTYKNAGIKISYNNGALEGTNLPFRAKGPIIDGWQRIESDFTIPVGAKSVQIELVNSSTANEAYFDDIRVHPFKSNMKSFVYDPSSQRLTAELDENNYATFYEYDDEGILVRVKKETERGVMTIKESRNNQSKIKVTQNP